MWALLLLVAVATTSAWAVAHVRSAALTAARAVDGERAFFAAEGGVAHARWELARDPAYAGAAIDVGGTSVRVRVVVTGETGWSVESSAPGALLRVGLSRSSGLPRIARWERIR
jgi:hypothetical protein